MSQYTRQDLQKDITKIFKNALNGTNMEPNDEFRAIFTDGLNTSLQGILKEDQLRKEERAGPFNTSMFFSEAVALLKNLKNIQKARDTKFATFVDFLEVEVLKGTGYEALLQTVII